MRMFGIILVSILTLMHVYVFWRGASVPFVERFVPGKVLVAMAVVLWAGIFLAFFVSRGRKEGWAAALELFGMDWMAILFLAFTLLLAADVATGFGWFLPRFAPSIRGWALIAAGILSIVAIVQGTRAPGITSYEVRLSGLPPELDGSVLVAVSDLHLGSQVGEKWTEKLVDRIEAQKPAMVALVGDIIEGRTYRDELLPALRRLSAPLGVWMVEGNHEYYGGDVNLRLMKDAGYEVLRDRWVSVRPGLTVAGVDDLTVAKRSGDGREMVTETLAARPPGATIYLCHSPLQVEKAANAGVGLMLSGHTHNGQIWPFGYLVRFFYPYMAGEYDVHGMTLIVCRGTGTWGPRMRLWQRAEILRITLRAG